MEENEEIRRELLIRPGGRMAPKKEDAALSRSSLHLPHPP